LSTIFGKRRQKQFKLVKSQKLDLETRAKICGIFGKQTLAPAPVKLKENTIDAISKKSLFEGTHPQPE
jgi:hypothetical protein